ncbi:MAG TPA: SDR family oxidoreductase [Bacteroidia bacterium]|jgi:3-oxoacyl-[acyl-carrier protein] reductase|nr:SDR family oxidoreductase [Bacteroidia bacterium]
MNKFEDLNVGDKAELKHLITQEDINKFVDLTGDDNKLHIDTDYAKKTSFKKPVAHGMLGASFISTIIGTKMPGDGALWFSQTIEFLLPVRVGDELTVRAEILKKIDSSRSIELQTDIFNQHKQKVTSGVAKVKIVEQQLDTQYENENIAQNKNVIVIGGTGGIGKATCIELAKQGYNVAIHYNSNKEAANQILNEVIQIGVKACVVSGDVTSLNAAEEIINDAYRKLGQINVLINCATLKLPNIKFEKLVWSDIENHININVKSNFYLAQLLIPSFKEARYGKFIFLTSQVTENVPPSDWSFYTIAKYALNGFAKSLAVELAPFNIKVNLISPGMTETELIADIPERSKLLISAKTPLKRLAKADDIANAIVFLASDKADFITGETLRINGGQVML